MLYKKIFYLILCLPTLLMAQSESIIQIRFASGNADSCFLKADTSYIEEYNPLLAKKTADNQCGFVVKTEKNITAKITYKKQTLPLFLKSGDALMLHLDGDSLLNSFTFSGVGTSGDNQFLWSFYKQFYNDFDKDKVQQQILTTPIDAFEMKLFEERKKQISFCAVQDKSKVSGAFNTYIDYLIKYNYYACLLSFPIINANQSNTILTVNALPEVMLEGVGARLIDDEALICPAYRDFVTYYITYYTSKANGFNKFADYNISMEKKIMMAKTLLTGKTLVWYISNFLNNECEKVAPYTVKHIYDELKDIEKSGPYTNLLKNKCTARIKVKEDPKVAAIANTEKSKSSSKNPFEGIALKDIHGKAFNPKDIEGKVVFVDYWASWCGPCRREFPASKALHERFTSKQLKNIVFLYISIDGNEGNWKNAVNQIGMEGLLLISPGDWSAPIVKYFGINSIPRYMLIDKQGKIVNGEAPRPSSGDEIYNDILKLLAQ